MRLSVLISGLGIAGPTLAYWLLQSGFEVTVVERAARHRAGGYIIDFWGLGYDKLEAAERFGRFFAPRTRLGIFLRNQISRSFQIPLVADFTIGPSLLDRLRLPATHSR